MIRLTDSVVELNLPARVLTALERRTRIVTVHDLTRRTEADLLKVPQIGRSMLAAIKDALEEHGLALSGGAPRPPPALDPGTELALQRLRSLGNSLRAVAETDFPTLLAALERSRQGTSEALHVEAATYAARAAKFEQRAAATLVALQEERKRVEGAREQLRNVVAELKSVSAQRDDLLWIIGQVAERVGMRPEEIIGDPTEVPWVVERRQQSLESGARKCEER